MTYELNKNSLLSRFVFWSWGLTERDFSHICPFFWLAIFTILFSPFIVVAKSIRGSFRKLKKIKNHCTEQKKADFDSWADMYLRSISHDEKQMTYFLENFYKNKHSQLFRFYNEYLPSMFYPLYEKCADIYADYLEKRDGTKEAKAIERRKRINSVVKYTRPITKGILYALAAAASATVLYLVYLGIEWLTNLPKGTLADYLIAIAVVISCLAIIVALAFFLCKSKKVAAGLDNFCNWVARGGRNIGSFISIFFEENCPPVKWK